MKHEMGMVWLMQFLSIRNQSGRATVGDLPPVSAKLKASSEIFTEEEIKAMFRNQALK